MTCRSSLLVKTSELQAMRLFANDLLFVPAPERVVFSKHRARDDARGLTRAQIPFSGVFGRAVGSMNLLPCGRSVPSVGPPWKSVPLCGEEAEKLAETLLQYHRL